MLLQMAKFHSFWWLSNIPLYIYHIIFIHSPADGQMLNDFYVLAPVNNTAMNTGVHVSFQVSVFIFFRCIPKSGIAGSYGSYFQFFEKLPYCFPQWLHQFTFPPMYEGSLFSTSLPTFLLFFMIPILAGVGWYLIVVWYAFLWWLTMLSIFSCGCWLPVCLPEKYLFRSFAHYLIRLFGFFCFVLFFILGPHLRHMEVPRITATAMEWQPLACTTATAMPDLSHICNPCHRL